jgi:hypothetical protein
MEYQILCDTLYEILSMFPRAIIETIIFKYVVSPNKYIYLYTIISDAYYSNICFNKQLGIICCQNIDRIKLIDYCTGLSHDESLINIESLSVCLDVWYSGSLQSMKYFNNNIIISSDSEFINKHVYNMNTWRQSFRRDIDVYNVCVNDEYVYVISTCTDKYYICKYDLLTFTQTQVSKKYKYHSNVLQMSIHEDTLYIHDRTYLDKKQSYYIYAHDIINLKRKSRKSTKKLSNASLYKNKLYCYESRTVYVYDVTTLNKIHSFNIDQCDQNIGCNIFISDDIMMLSNPKQMIFFDIK